MTLTMWHCRNLMIGGKKGLCSSGVRDYMQKNNVDWLDFLANGVDTDLLPDDEYIKLIKEQFNAGR